MITKVTKWGNSLAVRIPKRMLDSLSLKEGAGLEFQEYGGYLLIKPIRNKSRKKEILASFRKTAKDKEIINLCEEFDGADDYWRNSYESLIENIKFLSSNKSLDFLKKEPDLYENY